MKQNKVIRITADKGFSLDIIQKTSMPDKNNMRAIEFMIEQKEL